MSNPLLDLTDAVNELVEPRTHLEPYTVENNGTEITRRHKTSVPPLLDQLSTAFQRGSSGIDQDRGGFGSTPSARLEAIDTYMRIDTEARGYAIRMNLRLRDDLTDVLRSLIGGATQMDREDLYDLAGSARAWTTWARIMTGWETPLQRPNATCLVCEKRGGLRFRGTGLFDAHAMCVNCGSHWTPDTIGIFTRHLEWEQKQHEAAEQAAS